MRIYDTCIFFNEEPLLELKLETLKDKVDVFCIVEGTESFTGKPHDPQAGNVLGKYSKFPLDIRYYKVQYPVNCTGAWEREHYLRNYLGNLMYDFKEGDIAIYGDVDEQVDPDKLEEIVEQALQHDLVTLNLLWLQGRANQVMYANGHRYDFWNTRAFTYKAWVDFGQKMQNMRQNNSLRSIANAGWHFSSMGGPEGMHAKLTNFAHTEYSGPEYSDLEVLKKVYAANQDIIQRPGVELRREDVKLPEAIWRIPGCAEYLGLV